MAQTLQHHDGRPHGHLQRQGDLFIRRRLLVPQHVAVHMAAAALDIVVQTDQRVHQALARTGDGRRKVPLPFTRSTRPSCSRLGERLAHDGARDAVALAQPMLTGQRVAGLQPVARDAVDDQLAQLVVHRRGGVPVDRVVDEGHQYATPACRITFA